MFVIIVLAILALCFGWAYLDFSNRIHPVQNCNIKLRTVRTRKKLYLIAGFNYRWVVEVAEAPDGAKFPLPEGTKLNCMVVENSPLWSGFRLSQDDVSLMQSQLCRHLTEYYPWIQVTEVLMPKRR